MNSIMVFTNRMKYAAAPYVGVQPEGSRSTPSRETQKCFLRVGHIITPHTHYHYAITINTIIITHRYYYYYFHMMLFITYYYAIIIIFDDIIIIIDITLL